MRQFGNKVDDFYDNPCREFPVLARALFFFCVGLVALFSKLYWRWSTDGPNPFKGVDRQAKGRVIVANHASMLDPVILVLAATWQGRSLRPLYKSEFDKSGFVTWFFSRIGAIPIKRDTADMKAIRRAVNALKRGEDICIFPEGTRVRDPHARPELHGGFAMIAQMAGAEVVPVAIDGSERICPSGKGLSRPVRVRMRYGSPITFDEVSGASRREKAQGMEELAMRRVYQIRAQMRGEAPSADGGEGDE